MVVSRKEAILLASFIKMLKLTENEKISYIGSVLAEKNLAEESVSEENKNRYLRIYLGYSFALYTNAYLKLFLSTHLNDAFEVKGKRKQLYTCACCGYNTLTNWGEYDICKVCFWENDGCKDENSYSSPNHMTLGEARKNFMIFNACDQGSLKFLDKDRFLQFASNIEKPTIP